MKKYLVPFTVLGHNFLNFFFLIMDRDIYFCFNFCFCLGELIIKMLTFFVGSSKGAKVNETENEIKLFLKWLSLLL